MRVLQVTTHLDIGGIANYIVSAAKALKTMGIDCLVASSGGDLEDELKRYDIIHRPLDIRTKFEFAPKVWRAAVQIAKVIKDDEIDIVHAHTRVSQAASFFASRTAHVPCLSTCHGFFKKRLGRRIFDFWGDKVIAISAPVRSSLINDFKVRPDRIALIHNGVEIDKFSKEYSKEESADLKERLGLGDAPVIGTIGRLSPVKGHPFFVEALKRVMGKGYRVKGIIIGSGPEERRLKDLARSLGIEDSICFIDSTADTHQYLGIMDIFVFPSINEGLGLSLLEAMVAARPCIASKTGGISDIIKDGESGLLFDVGDVDGLAHAIIKVLDDAVLRGHLGASGRVLVRDHFSLERSTKRIVDLYKEVTNDYEAK